MPQPVRFGLCTDQNLPYSVLVERWQHFEALSALRAATGLAQS